jgi:formylglycine-generating enzyme required for sulfatase activity
MELSRSPRRLPHWLIFLAACLAAAPLSADVLRAWHRGFVQVPPDQPSFAVHALETTQEVYAAVMGHNPSRWRGPRNSVEMLSWHDAVAFCEKATATLRAAGLLTDRQIIRLPTEAEWEIATRAGTASAYSFGDDPSGLGDYAWHRSNAAGNDPPAGAKKPNPWGLYDVHGYLWEWCADAHGQQRILRGGAWTSSHAECRSDSRRDVPPDTKGPDIGFRCVIAPIPAQD